VGALDPIKTLPLDHKSGSPESQLGLLPRHQQTTVIAAFLKYGIQRNAADAVGASVDDPKPTVSPEG
jgi:hypothetical protein